MSEQLLPERPPLTKAQLEFLETYSLSPFIPLKEICRQVGVRPSQVASWKKGKNFRIAMEKAQNLAEKSATMTRQKVMDGLLEAIDMAKEGKKPTAMISGWKEIGRMCGYYEPERREVTLNVHSEQLLQDIKQLPRDELVRMLAAEDQKLIEGEFEHVESATE